VAGGTRALSRQRREQLWAQRVIIIPLQSLLPFPGALAYVEGEPRGVCAYYYSTRPVLGALTYRGGCECYCSTTTITRRTRLFRGGAMRRVCILLLHHYHY